jgi:hypothetical protein
MDLVASLGAVIAEVPLGPAGSFAKQAIAPTAALVPAPAAERRQDAPLIPVSKMVLGALVGVSVGTAVSAGISYGLGEWLYPEVGGMRFAKVGAVSYLVPITLWLGMGIVAAGLRKDPVDAVPA